MVDIYNNPELEFRFPPDWAQPVMEWASPRFEAVFVLLHPFIKVPTELQPLIEPSHRWLAVSDAKAPVISDPSHVTWKEVQVAVSFPDLPHLLANINANAIGFYDGVVTEHSQEQLLAYLRARHLLAPETHYLPSTLKPQIRQSLDGYGIGAPKWGGNTIEESPYERENLLYATPYECPYSFICSSKTVLETIVQEFAFDGFFADSTTLFDWKAGAKHQRGCNTGAAGARVPIEPPEEP
jgi:hypothetical protein